MSTTKSTPDGAVSSTRHMLDELDALMERMLALPVNDLDELAREPLPRPALAATLTVLDAPESETAERLPVEPSPRFESPPPAPSYFHDESSVDYPTPAEAEPSCEEPSSASVAEETEAPPAPQFSWQGPAAGVTEGLTPLIAPRVPEPSVQQICRPRRSFAGRLLSPLVRFNLAFDRRLDRLGAMGQWFRGRSGRLTLGLVGIGMLVLAVGWVLRDLASWTR